MNKLVSAFIAIALLSAPPALAQTPDGVGVGDGAVVKGRVTASNADTGDLYVLNTTAGSEWVIELQSWNSLDNCRLALFSVIDDPFDPTDLRMKSNGCKRGTATLGFVSGGGAYSFLVEAHPGWLWGKLREGNYVLKVTQAPGIATTGLIAPGVFMAPPEDGTASTRASPKAETYTAGQIVRDCPDCPELVVVPAGSFMMGSASSEEGRQSNEGPRRLVTFGQPFAIGKYEVTFAEWDACVADGGCKAKPADEGWGRGRRPVVNVRYDDARQYVGWLSKKTGARYFIPSEAEWEYAARAGTDTPWNTGLAIIADDANILDTFKLTVPVGGFPPNAFGLHDTHGNVAEWVQDCLDAGYFGAPTDGGANLADTCKRIVRGGAFNEEPLNLRSATRAYAPVATYSGVGFRVARAL